MANFKEAISFTELSVVATDMIDALLRRSPTADAWRNICRVRNR